MRSFWSAGSVTLLAAVIFNVVAFGIGTLVASGSLVTRTTAGLLAPARNAGPVFAAVGIAFNNDPEILGALTGILLVGLAVGVAVAAYLARHRPPPETEAEPQAESQVPAEQPSSPVARDSDRSAAAESKPALRISAGLVPFMLLISAVG